MKKITVDVNTLVKNVSYCRNKTTIIQKSTKFFYSLDGNKFRREGKFVNDLDNYTTIIWIFSIKTLAKESIPQVTKNSLRLWYIQLANFSGKQKDNFSSLIRLH